MASPVCSSEPIAISSSCSCVSIIDGVSETMDKRRLVAAELWRKAEKRAAAHTPTRTDAAVIRSSFSGESTA